MNLLYTTFHNVITDTYFFFMQKSMNTNTALALKDSMMEKEADIIKKRKKAKELKDKGNAYKTVSLFICVCDQSDLMIFLQYSYSILPYEAI